MTVSYVVNIKNQAGVLVNQVNLFIDLTIKNVINDIDIAVINVAVETIDAFTIGYMIDIYRSNSFLSISNQLVFSGVIQQKQVVQQRTAQCTVTAVSWEYLLSSRIIAYPAGQEGLSQFTAMPVESIFTTIYETNLGALATVENGRLLNGVIAGAEAPPSAERGAIITTGVAGQNILFVYQKLAEASNTDFAIEYEAPATFRLKWYPDQLGSDRTDKIVLGLEYGTLAQVTTKYNLLNNATAIIVAGQGQAEDRRYVIRPATLPTDRNLVETWYDARNTAGADDALITAGDSRLETYAQQRLTYSAVITQQPVMRYGVEYSLGDLVSLQVGADILTAQIESATITVQSGIEKVDINVII